MGKSNERERVNIDLGSNKATEVPSRPSGHSRIIRSGSGDYLRSKISGADSTKASSESHSRDIGGQVLSSTIKSEGRKYKGLDKSTRSAYIDTLRAEYSSNVDKVHGAPGPSKPSIPRPSRPSTPPSRPGAPVKAPSPPAIVNKKVQNGTPTVSKPLKKA